MWFWIKVLRYIFITIFVLIIAFIAVLIVTHKQSVKKQKVIVEKYFETHYGNTDYVIDKIFDNYPISGVVAKILSPSSQDTSFELVYVNYSEYEVEDTYEEDVLSGRNTFERIQEEYNQLVNKTIEQSTVDFNAQSIWGRFYSSRDNPDDLYLQKKGLTVDKEYNIYDLGRKHGQIDIYADDQKNQYETVERIMLQAKEILDNAAVPFREMSVTLREPMDEDDNLIGPDKLSFHGVPYKEIEKESLMPYLKYHRK